MHRLRRAQDEAQLVDPPIKTNRRTGGVCGAFVMVTASDHSALTVAEVIHSRTLIDLLWISNCLFTLWAKMEKIIKYEDPPRAPDQQAAVAVLSVWPAAPRFVEAGNRGKEIGMNERMNEWTNERMNEWMNEWMNESINQSMSRSIKPELPSSTIPPEFDSTKRSLHHLDTVYLCRWVLVVPLVTQNHPKSTNLYWKLETAGIWENLSSLQWSLERIRWFHQSAQKPDAGATKIHETKWNNLRSINCFLCAKTFHNANQGEPI